MKKILLLGLVLISSFSVFAEGVEYPLTPDEQSIQISFMEADFAEEESRAALLKNLLPHYKAYKNLQAALAKRTNLTYEGKLTASDLLRKTAIESIFLGKLSLRVVYPLLSDEEKLKLLAEIHDVEGLVSGLSGLCKQMEKPDEFFSPTMIENFKFVEGEYTVPAVEQASSMFDWKSEGDPDNLMDFYHGKTIQPPLTFEQKERGFFQWFHYTSLSADFSHKDKNFESALRAMGDKLAVLRSPPLIDFLLTLHQKLKSHLLPETRKYDLLLAVYAHSVPWIRFVLNQLPDKNPLNLSYGNPQPEGGPLVMVLRTPLIQAMLVDAPIEVFRYLLEQGAEVIEKEGTEVLVPFDYKNPQTGAVSIGDRSAKADGKTSYVSLWAEKKGREDVLRLFESKVGIMRSLN